MQIFLSSVNVIVAILIKKELNWMFLILGPLTYTDGLPAREFIVGVVSWGVNCGKAQYPGVYARVTHVRDWIDEQMAIKC